jgi:uncharacterized protein (TIGR00369 family)
VVVSNYPPPHHLLSDLGIHARIDGDTTAAVRTPVGPQVTHGPGWARAGVLATLVDVVGGVIGARVLAPDWMATADLTLQMSRPVTGPWAEARGSVLRRGRTTLVVEALVYNVDDDGRELDVEADGTPTPAAWATMTFAVLPAREPSTTSVPRTELPVHWSFEGDGFVSPVAEAAGIEVIDATAGRVEVAVDPYLLNSFGAVQGGVMALLADVAGAEALGAALPAGARAVVTDLHVGYLALGKVGPIETRAVVLDHPPGADRVSAVVEVVDRGADDRLTTVVNVGAAVLADPGRSATGTGTG